MVPLVMAKVVERVLVHWKELAYRLEIVFEILTIQLLATFCYFSGIPSCHSCVLLNPVGAFVATLLVKLEPFRYFFPRSAWPKDDSE
jgi:hypothetical protein